MRRLVVCAAITAATCLPVPAYYHFVHYLNGGVAQEKFDLTALPGKTVTFFVSESGPVTYSATDTFNSVLSQLRQAATVWNGIGSSDLRVAFGGLENVTTPQNTPGGDVVFEDLPPGIYGYGGPTSLAAPVTIASGATFVPVLRAVVHLNRNLTVLPGPSYNETFFMTAVHEMGHALGLQHTFTSATMSQATTRATTLSHPIDSDDIAGISVLYPAASFSQFGSITGRVTIGSGAAHLTSVVAIRAGGGAVSGMTNADGTYRIDGIPPGQYFVYAHPLPPDADIRGPWNADGSVAAASGPTNALFYPGTMDLSQAAPVSVQAGKSFDGVNISLASRSSVPIYDVGVYGYFNNNTIGPVKPAYVDMLAGNATVVASAVGLGSNGQAPGLSVQFLGGSTRILPNGVRPYLASGYTYVALDLGYSLGANPGPQHLIFKTPDFLHVLPAGIIVTQQQPPTVTGVSSNNDGTLTVTGTNWSADSRIYFDGLPATIGPLDATKGVAVVAPPSGADGQTATLTVYNSDGQNSQLVQGSSPVTWSYGSSAAPVIAAISPSSLPAGAEASVDITTSGFSFASGQVAVGFGTTDVIVRRVFVLSPNHLVADVSVVSGAALSNPDVSVFSGFQIATAGAGFQIAPAASGLPAAVPILTNALPGLTGSYAGATVSLYGSNLAAAKANPTITIGGQTATILYSSAEQINLQIPAGLQSGPAVLNLNNGSTSAYPVLVNVDRQPATISSVQNSAGANVDNAHPVHAGDLVTVNLTGFAAAGSTIDVSRVKISVGGASHNALQVSASSSNPAVYQVTFVLNANETVGASQSLIVYLDGASSYPAALPVATASGSFTPTDASGS